MNRRVFYLAMALIAGIAMALAMESTSNSPAVSPAPNAQRPTLASAVSSSPGSQNRPPTSGPVEPSASDQGLPQEFSVFQTRSAFARPHAGAGDVARGPKAALVVKGVVAVGPIYTAFIEDAGTKTVIQGLAGEALAQGRIKSIGMDAIEYEEAGNSRRIEVGQNLNGQVAPPTAPASRPAAAPTANPPSALPVGEGPGAAKIDRPPG
jgi:hypothetical protein